MPSQDRFIDFQKKKNVYKFFVFAGSKYDRLKDVYRHSTNEIKYIFWNRFRRSFRRFVSAREFQRLLQFKTQRTRCFCRKLSSETRRHVRDGQVACVDPGPLTY